MISDKPMGINIDKYFMPSVANVIGTDLSNYKVVEKNQFACNLMHVGRDERLPIAILEQNAPIIVSPAYYVFEIKPEISLMPSFLMLWFKRPEFDRNAWFYTDADVRGGLDRDSFLNMSIPVPSIYEQRSIVAEYQAVEERINSNNALVAQLEKVAISLYYEILSRDSSAQEGKDVHSSLLSDVADIIMGQSPDGESLNEDNDGIVFYQGRTDFGFRFPRIRMYTNSPTKVARNGDVLLSVRAPVGDLNIATCDCCIGRGIASLRSKLGCNSYLYYLLKSLHDTFKVSDGDGTIFGSISKEELFSIKIEYPGDTLVKEFEAKANIIDNAIQTFEAETEQMITLRALLLAKLS